MPRVYLLDLDSSPGGLVAFKFGQGGTRTSFLPFRQVVAPLRIHRSRYDISRTLPLTTSDAANLSNDLDLPSQIIIL